MENSKTFECHCDGGGLRRLRQSNKKYKQKKRKIFTAEDQELRGVPDSALRAQRKKICIHPKTNELYPKQSRRRIAAKQDLASVQGLRPNHSHLILRHNQGRNFLIPEDAKKGMKNKKTKENFFTGMYGIDGMKKNKKIKNFNSDFKGTCNGLTYSVCIRLKQGLLEEATECKIFHHPEMNPG